MKTGTSIGMTLTLFILLLLPSIALADEGTVSDPEDDVYLLLLDMLDLDENASIEQTSERPNLDIVKISYERIDGDTEVTISFEVNSRGEIEDSDFLSDLGDDLEDILNFTGSVVQYFINIETNQENTYTIEYINKNCTLDGFDIDYTVSGNVLTTTFNLDDASENITDITAISIAIDYNTYEDVRNYFDAAPDSSLFVVEATSDPSDGETGQAIEFTGSADDNFQITQPPYSYTWDFDDGTGTHTGKTVSHTFQYAGTYIVELTVEDTYGIEATDTYEITVSQGSGGNGTNNGGNGGDNDSDNSGLLLFVGIIAVIVIIGMGILVYVIRR